MKKERSGFSTPADSNHTHTHTHTHTHMILSKLQRRHYAGEHACTHHSVLPVLGIDGWQRHHPPCRDPKDHSTAGKRFACSHWGDAALTPQQQPPTDSQLGVRPHLAPTTSITSRTDAGTGHEHKTLRAGAKPRVCVLLLSSDLLSRRLTDVTEDVVFESLQQP